MWFWGLQLPDTTPSLVPLTLILVRKSEIPLFSRRQGDQLFYSDQKENRHTQLALPTSPHTGETWSYIHLLIFSFHTWTFSRLAKGMCWEKGASVCEGMLSLSLTHRHRHRYTRTHTQPLGSGSHTHIYIELSLQGPKERWPLLIKGKNRLKNRPPGLGIC